MRNPWFIGRTRWVVNCCRDGTRGNEWRVTFFMVCGISGMQVAHRTLNPDANIVCLCIISMITYANYCLFKIMFTPLFGSSTPNDPFPAFGMSRIRPYSWQRLLQNRQCVWKSKVDKMEWHARFSGGVVVLNWSWSFDFEMLCLISTFWHTWLVAYCGVVIVMINANTITPKFAWSNYVFNTNTPWCN